MLEEEYEPRRRLPRHLRPEIATESAFEYTMREVRATDLPHIREIYNYYVANSTVTFDEDAMTLTEWRDKFYYLNKQGMPFVVAVSPAGQILGYALVSPWKQKKAYRFTVEDSVYVAPEAHGRGVGKALLSQVLAACEGLGLRQMMAVIGDSGNSGSIGLHTSLGFEPAGVCRSVGFKHGRWVDTVWMQKPLNGGDTSPPAAEGLALTGH